MKKISETIIESGIDLHVKRKERTTVRGVVLKGDEILMVYSEKFNDYTFPGGGKKKTENFIEALEREMREEVGAVLIRVISKYGFLEEVRHGINNSDSVYDQKSIYYLCEILEFGASDLVDREKEQGVTPKWIKLQDALSHNQSIIGDENHSAKGAKTVLPREIAVLKSLIEDFENEKI